MVMVMVVVVVMLVVPAGGEGCMGDEGEWHTKGTRYLMHGRGVCILVFTLALNYY